MVHARADKRPVNSEVSHPEIAIYPFRDTTQAAVVLVSGHGDRAVRLRLWAGYLDCSRGDLSGLDAGQVTVLLCGHLQRAVSYTHLRAHETRHDLVCRLLLEKK